MDDEPKNNIVEIPESETVDIEIDASFHER